MGALVVKAVLSWLHRHPWAPRSGRWGHFMSWPNTGWRLRGWFYPHLAMWPWVKYSHSCCLSKVGFMVHFSSVYILALDYLAAMAVSLHKCKNAFSKCLLTVYNVLGSICDIFWNTHRYTNTPIFMQLLLTEDGPYTIKKREKEACQMVLRVGRKINQRKDNEGWGHCHFFKKDFIFVCLYLFISVFEK